MQYRALALSACAGCAVVALHLLAAPSRSSSAALPGLPPVDAGAVLVAGPPQPETAGHPRDNQRVCFSSASDYKQPLRGEWREHGGTSGQHYAEVLGDRAALRRGEVNTQAADEWAERACPLEDAMHSCYYHGEERARTLSQRDFVASDCLLRRFDAAEFLRSLPSTDVWFVGDSIVRQLWQSVGCHLTRYGVRYAVWWVSMPWQGNGNCPFKQASHCYSYGPDCVTFEYQGANTSLCYIMNHPDMGLKNWLVAARRFKLQPGSQEVVVFNAGLHFGPGHEAQYSAYVEEIVEGSRAVRGSGGRFLWLETTPQHFPTPDGGYNASARGGACVPLQDPGPSWRNEIANVLMQAEGIDILYTFEHARSQWDAHVGDTYRNDQLYESGDCSHFCMPGVPDLWARMLFNMLTASRTPE